MVELRYPRPVPRSPSVRKADPESEYMAQLDAKLQMVREASSGPGSCSKEADGLDG